MKAQSCPVCFGRGIVSEGFYTTTTDAWNSGGTSTETCRSCDGTGYIVIPNDPVALPSTSQRRHEPTVMDSAGRITGNGTITTSAEGVTK